MNKGETARPGQKPYTAPVLQAQQWSIITGVSLPIGTSSLGDFTDQSTDFLEEQP